MIHKVEHIILRHNKNQKPIISITNTKFAYYDVIDEKGNIIDCYDVIKIDGEVRCDMVIYNGKWCVRIFPIFGKTKNLCYDYSNHRIGYDLDGDTKKNDEKKVKSKKLIREIYNECYIRLKCPHCKEELFRGHQDGFAFYKLETCRKCKKPLDMSDWIKDEKDE